MSIRFAARAPNGFRSALWSVFAMGGANVGVASADTGGRIKVNLHESGSWQYGYTSEYERAECAAGRWPDTSRHWRIWKRPPEVLPGYTAAIKILVPPVALADRTQPTAKTPVHWMEAVADRGIVFSVWIAKSSIPPWGYVADGHTLLGTLTLPTGENVLVGGHYVSAEESMLLMMRGLSGFLQVVMAADTTALKPFSSNSLLVGFSHEPNGAQVFTEITLHGLSTVNHLNVGPGPLRKPSVHSMSGDVMKGLMDIEVLIPSTLYSDHGINPRVDREAALKIAHQWNLEKVAEMKRLLGIKSN